MAWFWVAAATSVDGQMGEERFNLRRTERRPMSLAVEQDVAFNPVGLRLLGPDAVVLEPDPGSNPGQERLGS